MISPFEVVALGSVDVEPGRSNLAQGYAEILNQPQIPRMSRMQALTDADIKRKKHWLFPRHKFSLPLFRCVSVCSRHAAIAKTAVRPSQGSRSRNVMIIVALS
jgi:hypothetical protein